jgi:hypothetical protein
MKKEQLITTVVIAAWFLIAATVFIIYNLK